MKDFGWYKKLFVLLSNPRLLKNDKEYIFVLGHMRSRSSVLSHVLGSHDDIIGYTELHRSYANTDSLLKMRVDLYEEFGQQFGSRYLLDKVLHNGLDPSEAVIRRANPKLIFLLREPVGYVNSLIKLGKKVGKAHYANLDFTIEHYVLRVNFLAQLPEKYGLPFFYIDSDELVSNTDEILEELSRFLDLSTHLSPTYKKFEKTGKRRFGDSSENINSGAIVDTSKHRDESDKIEIPEDKIAPAMDAYHACREILINQSVNQTG